jgi:hypothetical protein
VSGPAATFSRAYIDPGDFCDGCGSTSTARRRRRAVCIHPGPDAASRKALIVCAECLDVAHYITQTLTAATEWHPSRDARNFPGGQLRDNNGVLVVDE